MAKSATKKIDVMEIEAEEITLETIIDNTLVRHNVTEAVIAGLKDKYGGLKLRDIEDKETYLEIVEARKDVRKYGILAEKICKAGRSDAIKVQKLWLGKESEVLGKIAEVQDPLDAEIKKFEDEAERKELAEAQRREEAYIKRQSQLLKMGATYDNGSFVLNHIIYEVDLVKECDDDIWNETILPKYVKEYEKNQAEIIAAEKKREEESAALKAQQEEMSRQRQELERQQNEFRQQQQQLKDQQDAADRERRLAEQKADDERREKERQKLQARGNQLQALGMTFNFQYDCYSFQDVNVDNKTEMYLLNDEEWDALVEKITPVIEQRKKDAEEKRLAQIEKEKQEAIELAAQIEREKMAEELRQQKIKEDQEAARKAEEALKATDKQKWKQYISGISNILIPEMKSPTYKSKIEDAGKLIGKLLNL